MASKQTDVSGVAGRYAAALFELAQERSEIDAVGEELSQLLTLIDEIG